MPVIDIHGEKKKVACGPCIRGHRSSKCQHSDRVLMEVRKPGRPLSACPHPSGSCGCQRAVYYTVPKNEPSATPSGPLSPATSVFSPPTPLSSNRVQKSKLRKNSTIVNTSSLQRALDGDLSTLAQHVNPTADRGLPTESSESSSNVPSLASSSSSTPQTEAVDVAVQSNVPSVNPDNGNAEDRTSRLRLGMLGVGGFGAGPDEVGWTGDWPDYNSIPVPDDRITGAPPRSSCCGNSTAPPEPKPVVATGSCCAPKTSQPPPQQTTLEAQPNVRMHNPVATGMSFPSHFSLPGPAFHPQTSNFNLFAEDQFGCLHQPDHACQCGEGCECLGCSMHPANRTTTDYVRYHTELTMRGYLDPSRIQIASPSSYVQQLPPYGTGVSHPLHGVDENGLIQPSTHFVGPVHEVQSQFLPWQETQHSMMTPTLEMSQFSLQQSSHVSGFSHSQSSSRPQTSHQPTTKQHELQSRNPVRQLSFHEASPYDHESPSTEDDASTLSPSAFSVQQFNIPGCSDVTGSCLCGDGCQCEGCVTHNGHGNKAMLDGVDLSVENLASQSIHNNLRDTKVNDFPHENFEDILRDPMFSSTVPG